MIYLLMEEENNLINSVITKLSSKMRPSSIVRLHRKTEESDVSKYKQPPMFDKGWFIVYEGNNNSVIKTLGSYDKNVTIVVIINILVLLSLRGARQTVIVQTPQPVQSAPVQPNALPCENVQPKLEKSDEMKIF